MSDLNEAKKSAIPTNANDFDGWANKQNFTPEDARLAVVVLSDLRILEKIDAAPPESNLGPHVELRAYIAKTRDDFEAALAANQPSK